jgi:hypothetical protein
MTLRILWNNYERWFKGIEALDPEQEELRQIKEMNKKNQD